MLQVLILLVALVVAAALAVGAIAWRRPLVAALPALIVLDGVPLTVGASAIHLEQIGAALLVVPLGASLLRGERRLRPDATTWWLAAIVAMNVVSTLWHSPAVTYSLIQCGHLASVMTVYVLVVNFLDTREEIDSFLRLVLGWGAAACAVAVGAYLLSLAGAPVGGAEVSASAVENLSNAYGAYGTMLEPNLLGSFSAATLLVSLILLVTARRGERPPASMQLLRWAAVASGAALLASFTRAAWVGAIAAGMLALVLGARYLGWRVRMRRLVVPTVAVVVGFGVLMLIPGSVGDAFRFKVGNLVNPESSTVLSRLITFTLGLQQAADHLVVGWGTFSFAPLTAQGSDFQQYENWRHLWISNYLVLALHDTGLVGLALWLGMFWSVLARGVRAAKAAAVRDPALAACLVALLVAAAAFLIPFLATSGFSLGFPWLFLGLLSAYSRVALEAPAPEPAPATIMNPDTITARAS